MNKEQLLRVLNEAKDKGQTGFFIWANWTIWDDIAFEMKPGNEDYDFAMSRISQNLPAVVTCYNNGFKLVAFIAVSVGKLSSDEALFNRVLEICNKNNYQGPFTLLPSNETVKPEITTARRKEGLHRESLVLPSSFRLNLGGAVRPQLRGKALKEFEEQKKKMTESFLKACGVRRKTW